MLTGSTLEHSVLVIGKSHMLAEACFYNILKVIKVFMQFKIFEPYLFGYKIGSFPTE